MDKAKAKRKAKVSAERVKAFAKTLKDGVSKDYLEYMEAEAKENRMIEKYL